MRRLLFSCLSAALLTPAAAASPAELPQMSLAALHAVMQTAGKLRPAMPPEPAVRDQERGCPPPAAGGPDAAGDESCTPKGFTLFPALGSARARRRMYEGREGGAEPINRGFESLGGAGSTGSVDGPGWQGNGKYRVLANEPYKVSIKVETGYVDGATTFTRDPRTGADTIHFTGWVWDFNAGKWGPYVEVRGPVEITYDSRKDLGRLRWQQDGEWKSERYWGGADGGRRMTIELGGGWDHTFKRD